MFSPGVAKAVARSMVIGLAAFTVGRTALAAQALAQAEPSASSAAEGFGPSGAINGQRFSTRSGTAWKARAGQERWWWQITFARAQRVGVILQIIGDHELNLRNAPKRYVWQSSHDGRTWRDLPETRMDNERRAFRIHRLGKARRVRHLRLLIEKAHGEFPTLREVEVYATTDADIPFPDWIVEVRTTVSDELSDGGSGFATLARTCRGWEGVPAQQVWKGHFDEAFVAAEPRPLCAFLSGNFKDWCEHPREPWRGVQDVLENRNLPIWAACGGAQALALLSTVGVQNPWDCPRCRDPNRPKSPIYTHIGHTGKTLCGDYSKNLFERGSCNVLKVADDPVLAGLPRQFEIHESHCGQIAYVPDGWRLVAARGRGGKTKTQCMRAVDRYIYAAQFHMETFDQTPANSRRIMSNFLSLAKRWGGYNPHGKPIMPADPLPSAKPPAPDPQTLDGVISIVIVGDSTVASYPRERKVYGWGQMLHEFFDEDVTIRNLAVSGRSSKSFIKEGRWERAIALRPDYVFVQFGHNDCPGKGDRTTDPNSTYQDYLRRYVDDAGKIGAQPILITPMTRRRFGEDGKIQTSLRPYADAMIKVAGERGVPVIDLHAKSVAVFETLGDAGSADLSNAPGDRTHFSQKGARLMAKLIVEDLPQKVPTLIPYLK